MAKPPMSVVDDGETPSLPEVPPPVRDLHATSDIRFVISELSKYGERIERIVKDFEKLETKIERNSDRIDEKLEKQCDKIDALTTSVDRVKTGAAVALTILTIVGGIFWWALGDRITNAVHAGLSGQQQESQQQAPVTVPLPPLRAK